MNWVEGLMPGAMCLWPDTHRLIDVALHRTTALNYVHGDGIPPINASVSWLMMPTWSGKSVRAWVFFPGVPPTGFEFFKPLLQ